MLPEDKFLDSRGKSKIWERYCGFLDLTVKEFMEIQEHLLLEQIKLVVNSPLSQKMVKGAHPRNIEEFRKSIPLTTYADYAPYIGNCQEDWLAVKPLYWARTSGRGGQPKWVPYTKEAIDLTGRFALASLILACATQRNDVRVSSGSRVMHNMPPRPYYTGLGAEAMVRQTKVRMIPPLEAFENESFERRIQAGFEMALHTGVDVLGSLATVLIRMGEQFTESSRGLKLSKSMLYPIVMLRLIKAMLKSRIEKRPLLPRDLWPLKGLICYGMDTNIYREQLKYYWGKVPLELYGSTETGPIAIQAWNKKGMTFFPFSCFLEFIPGEECLKNHDNSNYQPPTVLFNELEAGKYYELVITNFYGMPFLRYRIGDLLKIINLTDAETGIQSPQMIFQCRVDGIIDIGGFARLDERAIWQAIANTGIKYVDWVARKEQEGSKPILHIYIELKDSVNADIKTLIHEQLRAIASDYRDLQDMVGIQPLKITLLPQGSFKKFYEERRKDGADLAHLKPPHINASDDEMRRLTGIT